MTAHLNEEELVLLHYGEPCEPVSREHLESCNECQAEARRLAEVLALVEVPVEEPDSEYETQTWERLKWRLKSKRRKGRGYFGSVAAAAALLIVGLVAGLWINRPARVSLEPEVAEITESASESRRDRVLLLVVSDHLDRTERVLLELSNASTDNGGSIRAEQRAASDLVSANRLYRQVSESRDPKLNALLEEIEPVLVALARAPDDMSAEDLRSLQKRIEEKGLIFKLRVSGTRVRRQQKSTGPNI